MNNFTRRSLLAAFGSAVAISTAGCLGGDSNAEEDPYGGWFSGATNFEGTVDRTDQETVTVAVGANSGLDFAPPAVRITPGTTVVWEWTGQGGQHNVVEETGVFESDYHLEEGATFEYTFEEAGIYRYYCTPHRGSGMLGAVDVVSE